MTSEDKYFISELFRNGNGIHLFFNHKLRSHVWICPERDLCDDGQPVLWDCLLRPCPICQRNDIELHFHPEDVDHPNGRVTDCTNQYDLDPTQPIICMGCMFTPGAYER